MTAIPNPHEIAKAARTLKLARQCVRKVLKLEHNCRPDSVLTNERRAELEAVCVILARAESDVWKKFPV